MTDTSRSEKMAAYRRAYWKRFKTEKRRVYGTLSQEEYAEIAARAKREGRAVFAQIFAESCAYREGAYLPSKAIEKQIASLYVALRQIGNNINQIAKDKHVFRCLRRPEQVMVELARLEEAIAAFVERPWRCEDGERDDDH
ncbi:plasmid mobilization relaxosome protein MobC [Kordiimonas sp.]|uniref:plasmid mobilization relaxosome protein MobC n=1 Tax=Kordiimonas sp. TaxID=1970157 RepID=UPI003A8ED7DF